MIIFILSIHIYVERIDRMRNEFLLGLSMRENGDWNNVLKDLKNKVYITQEELHECYGKVKGDIMLFNDDDYPEKFKNIMYPPLCMYTHGNKSLIHAKRILAIVGSRNMTAYGESMTRKLVKDLLDIDPYIVIVSGIAKGIDSTAMRAAMEKSGSVIGISGAGIEEVYPKTSDDIYEYCHTNKGLLISEYPSNVPPDSSHFPMRNRLITGLCDAFLVVEGEEKSGTSISVGYALEQGKNVLALPRNIGDSKTLTNKIIKEGAIPVLSAQDIIDSFDTQTF